MGSKDDNFVIFMCHILSRNSGKVLTMKAKRSPNETTQKAQRHLNGRVVLKLVTLLVVLGCGALAIDIVAQQGRRGGSPHDFRKDRVRGPQEDSANMQRTGRVRMGLRTVEFPDEFRTITGVGNNLEHPEWGSAEIPFLRPTTIDYADGVDSPSGEDRPNAREISNAVCAQGEENIFSRRRVSDFIWQWGQFLDHDITLTPVNDFIDPFNIEVPEGDPFFDPLSTGSVEIHMDRAFGETVDGIREQINELTAFVDASNVYGSDLERAEGLRTNDGTGRLLVSEGDLLPFNTEALPNAPSDSPDFFLAGDFRANEQVGLTAMHTLFVREHNYWADVAAKSNPNLNGDQIYELARVIVGAEMQVITYNEFLPILLGPGAIPRYRGYRKNVDPGITNVFATASYRFGHSMLSSQLLRLNRRMREVDEGHLDLASAFFDPTRITEEGGIDPLLRGLAAQRAQEIDTFLVDDVRNFLFGPPGAGGFDLASLNIQRGRDHGLPSYNEVRRNFGLRPARDFDDINRDRDMQRRLSEIYEDVDDVDIWVGGLAEPHVRGALVGETVFTILREQFIRLRDGDRFWYQNHLDRELQRLIEQQTLAQIIRRNTDISREISDVPWIVAPGLESLSGGGHMGGVGRGQPKGRGR
ncbi:MAG: peroxidase family protein [Verrucomicrobiota bacterium]